MKNMLLALALIPLVIGPIAANPPCIACAVAKVRNRVIVKEKVVAIQVPVFVVPTYSATFIPPAPIIVQQGSVAVGQQSVSYTQQAVTAVQPVAVAQAAVAQASSQPDLAAVFQAFNARLCAIEAKLTIATPPVTNPPNGNLPGQPLAVPGIPKAFNKCAACHEATKADTIGGKFVMFKDGKLSTFNDRQLRLIGSKAYSGAMPPKDNKVGVPPLTDEEVGELMGWVSTQK